MPTFIRLTDYKDSDTKEQQFANPANRHTANQDDFSKIPGSPIAYWASNKVKEIFALSKNIGTVAEVRQGFATGDNDRFLRYWYEIGFQKMSFNAKCIEDIFDNNLKWVPCNKGGSFRKWYGNNEYVVAFDKTSYTQLSQQGNNLPSKQFYFKKGVSWSTIASGPISFRYSPEGFVFETKGSTCFPNTDKEFLGVFSSLNTKLTQLSHIKPNSF